jgi:hypothetical protein
LVWLFDHYLISRINLSWQLEATGYDDILLLDVSILFSTKKLFLRFLRHLLKVAPNEHRPIVNPSFVPGSVKDRRRKKKRARVRKPGGLPVSEIITFFHPARTFVNADLVHPDSFSNIKIWYFLWSAIVFSADSGVLKKKF